MTNKTSFGEVGGREWLTYKHNGKKGAFAFPPARGTHKACYQAIKEDSEIVPAERLDLVLLTQGAYTESTPRWQKVKGDCFVSRYTRAPLRVLWVPHGNELAGILLERDLEGKGRTTKMQLPKDISGWVKGENGIYESPDKNFIFAPEGSYEIGEHTKNSFAKDGFATAVLTAEGAEIFARTAVDAKLKPWTWGYQVKNINEPEQVVVGLSEGDGRLLLSGSSWDDYGNGFAFGVSSTGEASTQKN